MTSVQGVQANKMPFFKKFALKTHSRSQCLDRPWFNRFWFFKFIIYIIYIRQQQVLFLTQKQLETYYSATSTFNCWGFTGAVLVYEYLFNLVKAKDDRSVLKNCQVKKMFQPGIFWGFFCIIIYINYHGRALKSLFLTFIEVDHGITINLGFTD